MSYPLLKGSGRDRTILHFTTPLEQSYRPNLQPSLQSCWSATLQWPVRIEAVLGDRLVRLAQPLRYDLRRVGRRRLRDIGLTLSPQPPRKPSRLPRR
ncbi:hypothetical protein [Kribbella qitaiheensis]|uniref:hypothetical protein n=1 Tax=Kribbella qitaiheensis TaxID=1544730 RepID=UPI001624A835|nr:hypothetical protein [Kribbella qitaiheensis]